MLETMACDTTWPNFSKKLCKKDTKAIKIEARSWWIANPNNYVITHPMQEDSESGKIMVNRAKSIHMFKKNTHESRKQDVINLLLMS